MSRPEIDQASGGRDLLPLCEDGVVQDDGSAETGYGWVPSVIDGVYVQEFEPSDFPSGRIDTACICWMRTRDDATIDFEIVIYGGSQGIPLMEPTYVFPARATGVPVALDGAFYEVDLSGVELGHDTFFLGARWNPSVDQFFFICADHTEETPFTEGWMIDDRADEWGSISESGDYIFDDHRAMLIRAVAAPDVAAAPVPDLGTFGIFVFVSLLAVFAFLILRRRQD